MTDTSTLTPQKRLDFSQVLALFLRPRSLFERIAAEGQPTWTTPMLILSVTALLVVLVGNLINMALDPLFNWFTADCHSKPVYQLLRGGYYPSFGKPHDGLGFVPPMMDHDHGSTAICGIVLPGIASHSPRYQSLTS